MKKHGCWDTGCAIYRAMIEPFPELKHTVVYRSIMELTTFYSIISAKCIIMSTFVIDGDKKQTRRIFPRKIISALDYMLSEI